MGTAFTYQGQLKKDESLMNGACDFRFSLWDAASDGTRIGAIQTKTNVGVSKGLLTIPDLDFGSGAFQGEARWLEIAVRCPAGTGNYQMLSPRQPLTPAPYALALPGLWTKQNTISPNVIGGYSGNSVAGGVIGASIGGGGQSDAINRVTGSFGTVAGGSGNTAGGYAVVAGGNSNMASGSYSFAVGRRAKATHTGTFVWADSTDADFSSTGTNQFLIRAGGVGVGTSNPGSHALSVYSSHSGVAGSTVHVANDHASGIAMTLESHSTDLTPLLSQHGTGDILRADSWVGGWHPVFKVKNNGAIECSTLTLAGGSDLSEPFEVTARGERIEPGTVVCIDPDHPGKLMVCQEAYDRTVVGVIAGAGGIEPGMVMGQTGSVTDGSYPVALTGRVYVWADASAGAIRPGDLLTTSPVPGHAMKVTRTDAQGAVLGKAMTPLEKGRGLVLIALQ